MNWLRSESVHDPAPVLRLVRRVELAFVPFALALAALLVATGSDLWWIGGASAGLGLLAAAPMGPAIRRAEARAGRDPEIWREWRRRADRLTAVTFAALAAVTVAVVYAFGGSRLAVLLGAMFAAASAAASAVRRRAG
jgi:hypothetical protein